jgi:hypothetical protein
MEVRAELYATVASPPHKVTFVPIKENRGKVSKAASDNQISVFQYSNL